MAGNSGTIDDYIGTFPPEVQDVLTDIRSRLHEAVPGMTEAMSYGIPTLKLDGRNLVHFAGWKNHVSLYPITAAIRRAHAGELKGYETAKGTVRFPLTGPLPSALVRRLVKARIREMRAKASS